MEEKEEGNLFDEATFLWNKAPCLLTIKHGVIHLKVAKKPLSDKQATNSLYKSINILNVICVAYREEEQSLRKTRISIFLRKNSLSAESKISPCFSLTVNYWEKAKKHKRRHKAITLQTNDQENCKRLQNIIKIKLQESLKEYGCVRPKKLLTFINPLSGKGKAISHHKNIVSPLFKLGGIENTVVVTEYAGHAKEYVQSHDLSMYDGIISVSGDGTYAEVVNGLLIAEQRVKGISLNKEKETVDRPVPYAKPSIKVGLIPAGSGNAMNWCAHGVKDVETATLQIICGESHPTDVLSMHDEEGKFVQFCVVSPIYALFAYALEKSESLRCFGLARFNMALAYAFIKKPTFPLEITYLPSCPSNPVDVVRDKSRCIYPCPVCLGDETLNDKGDLLNEKAQGESTNMMNPTNKIGCDSKNKSSKKESLETSPWQVARGNYIVVNCFLNALKWKYSPNGFSPSGHLSDGAIDILLMEETTTRAQLFKYLLATGSTGDRQVLPFLKMHRVKAFRFRPLSKEDPLVRKNVTTDNSASDSVNQISSTEEASSSESIWKRWCVDGDMIKPHVAEVWTHKGLVTFFGKGTEQDDS